MKTKEIQELYQIKLHSMDTILHQISLIQCVVKPLALAMGI